MAESDRGRPDLRVERGEVTSEELAALTVALLALRAAGAGRSGFGQRPLNNSRWWRGPEAYQAPLSWQ
ncbi:acyl-CoA carboxylase epsilon subunit [Kitasatospora sp. NBC_01266]|jgi:hypothetical protein|uniref:acyl-CoA carboxylase epsilon subunit n=1 Tax=Kitasatospora sp. NBC_01266 TaxID=2903572 RepID=UPI002E359AAA|nr:acyl-CoA carboxylase epsilon subunit [Kitasatospora sp. NBC_01266]